MSEVENCEEQTLSQIDEVLNLAKIKEDDVYPVTQSLFFDEQFNNNSLRLLQLDDHLLKVIEDGGVLEFKGDEEENVVLCSESKTYEINETETSNSLLLINGVKFKEDVKEYKERQILKSCINKIFMNYLEAIPGKPHLKKLEIVLNESMYNGPEKEYEVDKSKLLTFYELSNIIQSSTKELEQILASMDIVVIDDKIRLLDFEYHVRVLSYMLNLIDENSWSLDEINFEVTVESLKDLAPKEIVSGLFEKYTEESRIDDGIPLYSYKEKEVCITFAKAILTQAGKFNLNEFITAWKQSVPQGMVPDESWLYGIAIIDRSKNPNGIWGFSENSLPENVGDRFSMLFEVKEKWTVPEISPYIKQLTTDKMDVNALLTKYARAFNVDGVKHYCSKHSK